jgi:hypothetical protein
MRLIAEARKLGGPYVFRMNLNQQSSGRNLGDAQEADADDIADRRLRRALSRRHVPDHRRQALSRCAAWACASPTRSPDMYNYGHLQVLFDDGSVGWYEAGWGPMMSETAFFVKDVMSPNGCVSIVMDPKAVTKSDDIDTHTKTSTIRLHHAAATGADGKFLKPDDGLLSMAGEPGHQELCDREQAFVLKAIREDIDLNRHMDDAVQSLRICLAADESVRTGQPVKL